MALNGLIEVNDDRQDGRLQARDEMASIVRAARRVFRAAETRISANREALDRYRAGMEPADCVRVRFRDRVWSHGEVLDHLSLTGRMPDSFKGVPRAHTGALREALGIGEEGRSYRVSLFPAVHEVYAAMILLVHAKGLNLSVMARLKVTRHRGASRGSSQDAGSTRWTSTSPAAGATGTPRSLSRGPRRGCCSGRWLWESRPATPLPGSALPETEPLCLLPVRMNSSLKTRERPVHHELGGCAAGLSAAWHEHVRVCGADGEPIRVSLKRMRLSVQVIRGEAMGNSVDVSVSVYRGPDPQTHEQARPIVIQGLNDAVADAKRRVAARISESEAEAARTDPAPLAARLGRETRRMSTRCWRGGSTPRLQRASTSCTAPMRSMSQGRARRRSWRVSSARTQSPRRTTSPGSSPPARRSSWLPVPANPAVRERHYARHIAAFDDLLSQVPEPEVRRARADGGARRHRGSCTQLLNRSLDI